jgi:hypothetical protein
MATELNTGWWDEPLKKALESGNIEEVRKLVRSIWIADSESYLRIAQAMVCGMREALSEQDWESQHTPWEDLQRMTTQDFSECLQGKLSAKWIKQNIKYTPKDSKKALEVKAWLDKWLDEHKDDIQALANFVQTLTGARAVAAPITFNVSSAVESLYPHTCSSEVDVPMNIDEDMFRATLDGYSKGQDLAFTSS